MTDSSGNTIPIEVITFDDQIEPEKKNDIIVKPEALQEAEQYTITISPDRIMIDAEVVVRSGQSELRRVQAQRINPSEMQRIVIDKQKLNGTEPIKLIRRCKNNDKVAFDDLLRR